MDEERKMQLFYAITEMAAHGLVLRAYHPDPAPAPEDEDQEDDQEEDDEEPGPEPYEEIDGVKYFADWEVGSDG